MAAISTLVDNFNDNSFDTGLWTRSSATNIKEQNQRIEHSGTASAYLVSATTYDTTSSNIQFKLTFTTGLSYAVGLTTAAVPDLNTDAVRWIIAGTLLRAQYYNGGSGATVGADLTYSSTTHAYLRIRESSGTTYWDYSSDGINWTNHTSVANPITLTAIYFFSYTLYNAFFPVTVNVYVDEVNVIPITTSTSSSLSTSSTSTSTSISVSTSSTSSSSSTSSTSSSTSLSTSSTSQSTSTSRSTSTSSTSTSTLPLIETLTDNFNDNSIDGTKWGTYTDGGSTTVESSGRITTTTGVNSTSASLSTYWLSQRYTFTNSSVYVEVISTDSHANFTFCPVIVFTHSSPDAAAWFYIVNGTLTGACYTSTPYSETAVVSTTFSAVNHRWLRLRESSGTTYWEYSHDGLAPWSSFGSATTPVELTAVDVETFSLTNAAVGAKSGSIDNFNIPPAATTTSTSSSISTSSTSSSTSFSTSSTSTSRSTSTSSTSSSTSFSTSTSTSVSHTTSTSSTSSSISTSSTSQSTSTSRSISTSSTSQSTSTSRSISTSSTSQSTSTSRSVSTSSTSASTTSASTSLSETTSTSSTSSSISTSSTSTSTTIITIDMPIAYIKRSILPRTNWRVVRPKASIHRPR